MLGAAVNIALDPVCIFALDMGVRGAAVATVLSQVCSAVYTPVSYTHLDVYKRQKKNTGGSALLPPVGFYPQSVSCLQTAA